MITAPLYAVGSGRREVVTRHETSTEQSDPLHGLEEELDQLRRTTSLEITSRILRKTPRAYAYQGLRVELVEQCPRCQEPVAAEEVIAWGWCEACEDAYRDALSSGQSRFSPL